MPQPSSRSCTAAAKVSWNCGRSTKGNQLGQKFKPGNTASVTHGLYSVTPVEFLRRQRELERDILAAETQPISPLRLAMIHNFCVVTRLFWQGEAVLEQKGYCDAFGKVRTALIQRVEALSARSQSLATTLGLKNEPKDAGAGRAPLDARAVLAGRDGGQ